MIKIDSVSKTYDKGTRKEKTVLDHVSLELPSAGFVFIVGESGVGKSTILNAIGGLMRYEGRILFDEKEENIELYRKRNISYIFQDFLLFDDLSVRENIKIALNIVNVYDEEEITKRVQLLLRAAGLKIKAERRVGALSLGQRQRVAIARALATSPKIILCDEPTGNLDTKNSKNIMNILHSLSKRRLVICVTHNLNLLQLYADTAITIEDAKFKKITSSLGKIEDSYLEEPIALSSLKENVFDSEDVLLKVYSDKKGEKAEIKIIKRNEKILVVGENLVLIKPSEAKFCFEKIENSQEKEELNSPIEGNQLIFEERNEKRKRMDGPFFTTIKKKILEGKREKKGLIRSFIQTIECLAPLAIFVLLNFGYVAVQEMDEQFQGIFLEQNAISLIREKKESNKSDPPKENALSSEDIYKILTDDNGIVDAPIEHAIRVSNFSFQFDVNQYLVDPLKGLDVQQIAFLPFESYREIPSFSFLKKYDLGNNEIIFDDSLVKDSGALPCFGGVSLKKKVINSSLTFREPRYSIKEAFNRNLKIVGLENTPISRGITKYLSLSRISFAFVKKELLSFLSNVSTSCHYFFDSPYGVPKFPSFEGFRFYRLKSEKDLKNQEYHFYDARTGDKVTNLPAFDHKILVGAYRQNIPLAFCSKEAYDEIDNLRNDLHVLFKSPFSIVKRNAEKEKAIYFLDIHPPIGREQDGSDVFKSSLALFFRNFIKSNLIWNRSDKIEIPVVPSNEGVIPIVLPNSMKDFFPDMDDKDFSNFSFESYSPFNHSASTIKVVGKYTSSKSHDPIAISRETSLRLKYGPNFLTNFKIPDGESAIENAINGGQTFFSKDISKTKDYFRKNFHKHGIKAISGPEVHSHLVQKNAALILSIFLPSISVTFIALVTLSALDAIGKINREKYRIGVYRCIGKARKDIFKDENATTMAEGIFYCLIPCVTLSIAFSFFYLYALSWLIFPFFLAYYIVVFLSSSIPLCLLLRKDPIDIIHSLQ